jgi:ABC-type uncharacterized transport system substrate-binding protein
MRIVARTVLLLGILGALVAGCASATIDGNATTADQATCDQAFAQAIALDPDSDTVSAIDGAIASCQSLEEWVQAADQQPDVLGGQDPAALASERCAASPDLAGTPVCNEIQSN